MDYVIKSTGASVRDNPELSCSVLAAAAKAAGLSYADRIPDSVEPLLDSCGQLNATDVADLALRLSFMPAAMATGLVGLEPIEAPTSNMHTVIDYAISGVRHGAHPTSLCHLGETLQCVLGVQLPRLRLSNLVFDVKSCPRHSIVKAHVTSSRRIPVVVTADTHVPYVPANRMTLYPSFFSVIAQHQVDVNLFASFDRGLFQDFLDSLRMQLLVGEDRKTLEMLHFAAAQHAAPLDLDAVNFDTWCRMQDRLPVQAATAVLSHELWLSYMDRTSSCMGFLSSFSAPGSHEQAFEGLLGTLAGTDVHTDGNRAANHRVLGQDEIIMTAPKRVLGLVSCLELETAHAVDSSSAGRAHAGVFMQNIQAIAIVDSSVVSRGLVR